VTRRPRKSAWYLSLVPAIFFAAACAAPSSSSFSSSASMKTDQEKQDQILLGRALVISHACSECHGGNDNPAAFGWMDGVRDKRQEFTIGPFTTRPKNLTPDNMTGIGRFSERQIFNSLRYGLRPGETADVEITSMVPGQGNFPLHPHYLAPPMPWPAWRHMSDRELYAIAAYLKNGLKPVTNKVEDSEGPPDFWASEYTVAKIGAYPAVPFPTAYEKRP
jgi:mono/diheme cytochrome c family protein